jgi:hypothetical protein
VIKVWIVQVAQPDAPLYIRDYSGIAPRLVLVYSEIAIFKLGDISELSGRYPGVIRDKFMGTSGLDVYQLAVTIDK